MKILLTLLVVLVALNSAHGFAFRLLLCSLVGANNNLCANLNQNQVPVTVVRLPAGTVTTATNNALNVPAVLNAANGALNTAANNAANAAATPAAATPAAATPAAATPAAATPATGAAAPAAAAPAPATGAGTGRDGGLIFDAGNLPYAQYLSLGNEQFEDEYEGARQRQRRRKNNVHVVNLNNRRGNRRRNRNPVRVVQG